MSSCCRLCVCVCVGVRRLCGMSFFYFVNLPNLLAVARGGSSPRLASLHDTFFLMHIKLWTPLCLRCERALSQFSGTSTATSTTTSTSSGHIHPVATRLGQGSPVNHSIFDISLNCVTLFYCRHVCEWVRERERWVEGAVSAMRGVCSSWGHFPW